MGTLNGKTAFVTGTSQGIGAAISKELVDEGCNVCMHYFSSAVQPEELKIEAENRGQKALCIQADLTNVEEVIQCVEKSIAYFGTFDVLVNNSGSLIERRKVSEVDNDFWNQSIDINLTSMMMITRELLPYINKIEGASIVNVSSLAGRKGGHPGSIVYSATKGAVLTWTRALSAELGPNNIRVNAVAPGFIEGTNFHKTHTSKASAIETIKDIPIRRSGNPEDVARAVAYLASEYDGFITGATLDINGGVYCA